MREVMHRVVDIHTHNPRPEVLSPTMAGIHPWDAERGFVLPDLSSIDIIGETGLDYVCRVAKEAQQRLLEWHLTEAERLQKPVVIHCVKAFEGELFMLGYLVVYLHDIECFVVVCLAK